MLILYILDCHAACATCAGVGDDQCTSCADGYYSSAAISSTSPGTCSRNTIIQLAINMTQDHQKCLFEEIDSLLSAVRMSGWLVKIIPQ